ncbi:MAG: hypothetical protein ACJ71X_08650 [Nitrososphaeraceae archaeon]|jgi:hypothetical protein
MGYTVITEKGIVNKDRFYLSKSLVDKFDGHNLWFKITQDEAHSRYRNIEQILQIGRERRHNTYTCICILLLI